MSLKGVKLMSVDIRKGAAHIYEVDEDETDTIKTKQKERLEDFLNLQHLQEINRIYLEYAGERRLAADFDEDSFTLTIEQLQHLVTTAIGTPIYGDEIERMFNRLDTDATGRVAFSDICTYLLMHLREKEYLESNRLVPISLDSRVRLIAPNHQQCTIKMFTLDNPRRLITVSKEGVICIWEQPYLRLVKVVSSMTHEEKGSFAAEKKRPNLWVTDAMPMPNCHKLVVATTSRELYFFDSSTGNFNLESLLFGLPSAITAIAYRYDHRNPTAESCLLCGDESGSLHIFRFTKPASSLFSLSTIRTSKSEDEVKRIWYNTLAEHEPILSYRVLQLHDEAVLRLQYVPENNSVLSCSTNSNNSVVTFDLQNLQKTYVFRISMGCNCFDLNRTMNLLATGGSDHICRLWNPYVTNRPVAILRGHGSAILDLRLFEELNVLLSYSREGVIKAWELKDYACTQTITLQPPVVSDSRVPDHGPYPLCLLTSQKYPSYAGLYIACNDSLVYYPMGHAAPPVNHRTTHSEQICGAIYNPMQKQVAIGTADSCVLTWDVETGNKLLHFKNAHGKEEIVMITMDGSMRRLITAARNGTLKVWNMLNGHCLHKLEPVDDSEVTKCISVPDKRIILSLGWSRKIAVYDDRDPDSPWLHIMKVWNDGLPAHNEDILAADYCPKLNIIATGSFDGELLVWSVETERMMLRLRRGKIADSASQVNQLLHMPSASVSAMSNGKSSRASAVSTTSSHGRHGNRARQLASAKNGNAPASIETLLFLRKRSLFKLTNVAILITSERGFIRWWCIYGQHHDIGGFYAPRRPDESALAICVDEENTTLAVADTAGFVSLFDIAEYGKANREHPESPLREPPPLITSWSAHSDPCVSAEMVEHAHGKFILTASTDKTVKLFSIRGELVGMFGQQSAWDLQDSQTWAAYKEEFSFSSFLRDNTLSRAQSRMQSRPQSRMQSRPQSRLDSALRNAAQNQNQNIPQKPRKLEFAEAEKPASKSRTPSAKMLENAAELQRTAARARSPRPFGSILGNAAEQKFQKKLENRAQRRQLLVPELQDVLPAKSSLYKYLRTSDVVDTTLPPQLPVSTRMLNRGYTSTSLLESSALLDMNLSFEVSDEKDLLDDNGLAKPLVRAATFTGVPSKTTKRFSRSSTFTEGRRSVPLVKSAKS